MNRRLVRSATAVVIGTVCAYLAVLTIDSYAQQRYPPPPSIDWSDADRVRQYLSNLPAGENALILATWIGGALVGALVASTIARPRARLVSAIVGVLALAGAALSFLVTPYPAWIVGASVVGVAVVVFAVGKGMQKRGL